MEKTTTVVPFRQVDSVDDPLTEIAREGARRMLAVAMGVEADAFVAQHSGVALPDGRQRVVRHGHGPMRRIQTGVGPLEVQRPKVRDRADVPEAEKIRFTSVILPRWARRSKSLDALLPVLYLRGISTGDFQEALAGLLGKDAPNLSPSVIGRLTAAWEGEYDAWRRRDLSARRYVYIWADGVYLQARMEPIAECMLVVIGATPEGKKELVGFQVGARESAQSWRELLVDLKARGLAVAPELAVGDGALGFWKALEEVFPSTRHQRCWVHKVVNVLNAVPNSMALQVKRDLNEITRAPDRAAATLALDTFVQKYGAKYEKAVACLERAEAPTASIAETANLLMAAYCPVVAKMTTRSTQEKWQLMRQFDRVLMQQLSATAMPQGSLIVVNVPLAPAIYETLSIQAKASGQQTTDFIAGVLARAARQ